MRYQTTNAGVWSSTGRNPASGEVPAARSATNGYTAATAPSSSGMDMENPSGDMTGSDGNRHARPRGAVGVRTAALRRPRGPPWALWVGSGRGRPGHDGGVPPDSRPGPAGSGG